MKKCNNRYIKNNIDLNSQKADYVYIITKQIVVNICEKLNSAGKLLTKKEKIKLLKEIKNSSEFVYYNSYIDVKVGQLSKKLYLYYWLFKHNKFRILLFLDKYSRKIVYLYRKAKVAR